MAYSVLADLENKFGTRAIARWSDVDETGSVDTANVADAISDADQLINEILFPVHTIPFSGIIPTITNISVMLAGFNLYVMRGLRDNSSDEHMTQVRQTALDLLHRIVDGQRLLNSTNSEIIRKGKGAPIAINLT